MICVQIALPKICEDKDAKGASVEIAEQYLLGQ